MNTRFRRFICWLFDHRWDYGGSDGMNENGVKVKCCEVCGRLSRGTERELKWRMPIYEDTEDAP